MSIDWITMVGNLSLALPYLQKLISGAAYLVAILFFMTAIGKLRKIGDYRTQSSSQEKMLGPIAYFVGGAALLFLPSSLLVVSNTLFGQNSLLQYGHYNPYNIFHSVGMIIKTAGLLWFVRGCILLVHASEPGVQEGPKGLAFLFAGILAMNFQNTWGFMIWLMQQLEKLSVSI